MPRSIVIKVGSIRLRAELNDTETAGAVWNALPTKSRCKTWGQEIYFSIPVEEEDQWGLDVVNAGDLAYWPPGKAFCIFFGPTPASSGNEIRPASKVILLGRVLDELRPLLGIQSGAEIVVEAEPA